MSPFIRIAAAPTAPYQGGQDARTLLAELYQQTVGEPMPPLLRHSRGKPYFSRGQLHCSISHTRSMVFCALSSMTVGLDAERLDRKVRTGLEKKILSPQELELWQHAPNPNETLLTLWTLKESAVKYTGQGLQGYPANLSFDLHYPEPRLEGSPLHFRLLYCAGHVAALCSPVQVPCSIEFFEIPPHLSGG